MSGQASGWVLRHGPKRTMLGQGGKAYGAKARGMRSVLVAIADAANRDGEHSHPGYAAICEMADYGRRQVATILDQLEAEGWIEVEEQGGGRGNATVYRIPGVRSDTAQPLHLSEDANRAIPEEKPRSPEADTAQSGDPAPYSSTDSTEDPTTRAEAERLCRLLSDLMVGNGCKPPNITKPWIDEMDRMMRLDGRTSSEVENCIRWSQADSFWQSNILSPKKLRAKYDQLRLAAKRQGARPSVRSAERDRRQDLLFEEIRRAEEAEAG